jgi:hypothetical protein
VTVSAPLLVLSDCAAASAIVAFVAITRAPKLLTSLARKVPPDIVPMPVDRLSNFCRRVRGTPIALNGLVVCVPEESLPEEDRAIVDDLGSLIPVLRVHDDPREEGRAFFDRCRQAAPRVPRAIDRFEYRRPVVVAPGGQTSAQRLLLAENVSPGGLFLKDPCLSCDRGEVLRLRFPGLPEVPELRGRVRWVRTEREGGQPLGYGCAFDNPVDAAVRRLLADARTSAGQETQPPPLPRSRPRLPSPRR